jgi:hypothetical protein
MSQLPAAIGWVHAPALHTSFVQAMPSLEHVVPFATFDHPVALVAGWHDWHAFAGFAVPCA